MKKIKKLIVSLFLLMTLSSSCFAQWAVIDAANLTNAVQQLYQTYQQIQHAIEQVQNTYKQIEQAAKQMASTDWEAVGKDFVNNVGSHNWGYSEHNSWGDWVKDPLPQITATKQTYDDILKLCDDSMNRVNKIADALRDETIEFGGMKVSVADLCGCGTDGEDVLSFGKNAGLYMADKAVDVAKSYSGSLTYQEREAIMRASGVSAENYATGQYINYIVTKEIQERQIESSAKAIEDEIKRLEFKNDALKKLAQKTPDGSIYAQTQLNSTYLAEVVKGIGDLGVLIKKAAGTTAADIAATKAQEALEKKQEQEEKEIQKESESNSSLEDSISIY